MKTGGCQCGELRYEVTGDPLDVYCCHCTECRKQSASAHGISVIVRRDAFRLTAGEPKIWTRPADSGNTVECLFCPTCGTRIVHRDEGDHESETLAVKGGSFDEPVDLTVAKHIWTDRALPGYRIPDGVQTWPQEP